MLTRESILSDINKVSFYDIFLNIGNSKGGFAQGIIKQMLLPKLSSINSVLDLDKSNVEEIIDKLVSSDIESSLNKSKSILINHERILKSESANILSTGIVFNLIIDNSIDCGVNIKDDDVFGHLKTRGNIFSIPVNDFIIKVKLLDDDTNITIVKYKRNYNDGDCVYVIITKADKFLDLVYFNLGSDMSKWFSICSYVDVCKFKNKSGGVVCKSICNKLKSNVCLNSALLMCLITINNKIMAHLSNDMMDYISFEILSKLNKQLVSKGVKLTDITVIDIV